MKTWEAETLATTIAQSWPNGSIAPDVWADELAELDHRQADATLRDLRRKTHRAPTIAEFRNHYNARTAPDPADDRCLRCDGWGWVTDDPRNHPNHWPGKDWSRPPVNMDDNGSCNCNVAIPCTCPIGANVRTSRPRRQVDL